MAEALFLLTIFHVAFFRRFYFQQSYYGATAEVLETYLGSSRLLGEWLRGKRRWGDDPYYYANPTALPFLSLWYPPHCLQAYLGSFCSLNGAYRLLTTTMALHYWLASISVYILWRNLSVSSPWIAGLAALTLSYSAYSMKPTPCIVYTLAWVPTFCLSAMLHSTILTGISVGMMLLAGYWPMVLITVPVGCLAWLLS